MKKSIVAAALAALMLAVCVLPAAFAAEEAREDGPADPDARITLQPVGSPIPLPVVTREPGPFPIETLSPIRITPLPVETKRPEPVGPTEFPFPVATIRPVPPGSRERVYGDMNNDGNLDAYDAAQLLRRLVGPTVAYLGYGDANGDGAVDGRDVTFILTDPPREEWNIQHEVALVVYKPVLYLYPRETTDVTVTLGEPDALTCVYPAYDGGWRVTAQPDGTLTGAAGREYYALYYEADVRTPDAGAADGFVIARDEVADFLEQKLAILGLSEREAEEMIVYWLPRLQQSEYVFIRFASAEAVGEAMPLGITPAPDTVIRVWMQWRGLDAFEDVPPQTLAPAAREGFTVVEWGGMELD